MDIFSAVVIVVPIIVPIALKYGIDPIHLCVIFLVNLEIGYSTPPIGMNLFISSIKFEKPVTLHDPCNISRGGGLHEKARYVVRKLCKNFIEMQPNREHNFCCTAGGGVINCGPPFKNSRMKGSRVKADQILKTGAKVVLSPCHNCHSGLEDISRFYDLGVDVRFITDLIYEAMEKK